MADIQGNIGKLKQIRELGVGIAIDDFGTGYSSLAYLARLPVQTPLAHSLRLKVVAEGVDAEEQAKVLRRLGCDEMQGYFFSRPLPTEEITPLLRKAN